MSELITREKELIKLNQHFDMLVTETLEKHPPQQQHHRPATSVTSPTTSNGDPRFCTYTKYKNTTPPKKRGAGDGIPDTRKGHEKPPAMSTTDRSHASTVRGEPQRLTGRCMPPKACHMGTATSPTVSSGGQQQNSAINNSTMLNSTTPPREMSNISTVTQTHIKGVIKPSTQRCRNAKPPESARICSSRGSTSRSTSGGGAFTVRYRNLKFVESPSLEMLLHDETNSIRRRTSPSTSFSRHGSDKESSCSALGDPGSSGGGCCGGCGGGSSTRRSTQGVARKNLNTDGLIKFLKSKVAILEEDHDRISQEMVQQKALLDGTLDRQKKVEEQRDQAYAKYNSLSEQLSKTELQLEEANRRMKERSNDQAAQLKEVEVVKRELKVLAQTNANLEKRLQRASEELENAKKALSSIKDNEREVREQTRSECESRDKLIKSLKKQRADLLNAYKKQLFLIDNLKRQNLCLEQSKMLNFNEKEFTRVLDWDSKT